MRRRCFETLGSDRYSKPADPVVHDTLNRYLPDRGFFVEAGAVDGVFESNTYFLERFRGWKGVLIEPVPEMHRRLATNRPAAIAVNCALVSSGYVGPTVSILASHAFSHIMASDDGAGPGQRVIEVPARTLSSVLDEIHVKVIDLLSLDVEGFEIQALDGLDFRRHQPRFMLIECLSEDRRVELDRFLGNAYVLVAAVTHRDFLYSRR
jgi:FkbM family methyltransferase